jgi:acetolactate synthase regulatory subunit
MHHLIHIDLTRSEGALVRILGLIERRGFEVLDMHLMDEPSGRQLILRIDGGGRKAEVLQRQLLRLQDVVSAWLKLAQSVTPFSGDESPHQCVRALGDFGVRHHDQARYYERPPSNEVHHV